MKEQLRIWSKRIHIGTIAGVVVAIYIGIYLVDTVHKNYLLQRQITDLNEQIATLRDEQTELKYRIQYYQTDAFKEKEARAKLGLQAPGEGVVILPKKNSDHQAEADKKQLAPKKSNWQQWIDFLSGKGVQK